MGELLKRNTVGCEGRAPARPVDCKRIATTRAILADELPEPHRNSNAQTRQRPREAAFAPGCCDEPLQPIDPDVSVLARFGRALRFQRWRALKRGFDLQITKTLPRRRTTLQSR
jgi:hypothetical protein